MVADISRLELHPPSLSHMFADVCPEVEVKGQAGALSIFSSAGLLGY